MAPQPITENTLFYGDNLDILRQYLPDDSVDLIYLDPPFNSSRSYNVLFKDEHGLESEAQMLAFEDTWHWNEEALETYQELSTQAPDHIAQMIAAMYGFIGGNQMMAYLVMMTIRLIELHRVLKPTGSLYLHCDPTASHYLKIILDTIFGKEHFVNEIVWQRTNAHNMKTRGYVRANDTILLYSKTDQFVFNEQYTEYGPEQLHRFRQDEQGRLYKAENLTFSNPNPNRQFEWRGTKPPAHRSWGASLEQLEQWYAEGRILLKKDGTPRLDGLKVYLEETKGKPLTTNWTDIERVGNTSTERLGYPTQKPLSLLERIIQVSSDLGDVVLDPFCGCGTAVVAAQKLGRAWIGIDVTHLSIALMKYRLEAMFSDASFKVVGEPTDVAGARNLARSDRYQFQWWALSLIRAKPLGGQEGGKTGKKGSDKGIDGVIAFIDEAYAKPKRVLVQVKSGKVNSGLIRDLVGTVQREQAAIGVFITLEQPTRDMLAEALSAGYYHSEGWNQDYPRIQILTINDLLHNRAQVKMPPQFGTFKQARRAPRRVWEQRELGFGT